ncbi:MAG: GDSL family lipase [Myxococcales bacterium]|nr:GDSL family lipase [Myxococcales bacterium]
MKRRMRTAVALCGLAFGAVAPIHAQTLTKVTLETSRSSRESAGTLDSRWRESLEGFAALDKARAPAPGGVVFVGSSSIRLWNDLEREFGTEGIVKRGFGGSRLSDVARYAAQLVLPYKPRLVVVYAGDNDLAEGASPEAVLASYADFVAQVHAALPQTRIAYLSIKPSPSREALMPAAIQANEQIERWSKSDPMLDYIDVYTRMLDKSGRPRADLFLADSLHLNAAGYAIWKSAIAEHLR